MAAASLYCVRFYDLILRRTIIFTVCDKCACAEYNSGYFFVLGLKSALFRTPNHDSSKNAYFVARKRASKSEENMVALYKNIYLKRETLTPVDKVYILKKKCEQIWGLCFHDLEPIKWLKR